MVQHGAAPRRYRRRQRRVARATRLRRGGSAADLPQPLGAMAHIDMMHASGSRPHIGAPIGPWDQALLRLRDWDPAWAQACEIMTMNPWRSGVLPRKTLELVSLALNAACTTLDPNGTRRHMRAALREGASREEILTVVKMASVMAIHSCSLAAPILLEEARAVGVQSTQRQGTPPTPACDALRRLGQWNEAWTPFVELDPGWTEEFMAAGGRHLCRRGSGAKARRASEHRLRRLLHPSVRSRHATAHQGGARTRGDGR